MVKSRERGGAMRTKIRIVIVFWAALFFYGPLSYAQETFSTADEYIEEAIRIGNTTERDRIKYLLYKAIELDPSSYRANAYLGALYANLKDFDLAFNFFDKAIALNSQFVDTYLFKGFAYLAQSQVDKALDEFNRILSIKPCIQAYYGLGAVYGHQGKYSDAVRVLTTGIELGQGVTDPKDIEVVKIMYIYRADAYLELKEYDKCWADVREIEKMGGAFPGNKIKRLQEESGITAASTAQESQAGAEAPAETIGGAEVEAASGAEAPAETIGGAEVEAASGAEKLPETEETAGIAKTEE